MLTTNHVIGNQTFNSSNYHFLIITFSIFPLLHLPHKLSSNMERYSYHEKTINQDSERNGPSQCYQVNTNSFNPQATPGTTQNSFPFSFRYKGTSSAQVIPTLSYSGSFNNTGSFDAPLFSYRLNKPQGTTQPVVLDEKNKARQPAFKNSKHQPAFPPEE